jgi:hypothetical protein
MSRYEARTPYERHLVSEIARLSHLAADLHKGVCSSYAGYKTACETEIRGLKARVEELERATQAEPLLEERGPITVSP